MLFFYFSSGEGPRWYIGPLIMLAPLVLNLLPAVAEELYSLLFTPVSMNRLRRLQAA